MEKNGCWEVHRKSLRDQRRLQSELLRAAAYTVLGPPKHGARPEKESRPRGGRVLSYSS